MTSSSGANSYCFQTNPLKSETFIIVPVSFRRRPSDTTHLLIMFTWQVIDLNPTERCVLLAKQDTKRLETCLIMLICGLKSPKLLAIFL